MALDPRIPLGVMTPGEAQSQALSNQLKAQQVQQNEEDMRRQREAEGQPNYDEIGKKMDIGMKLISTVKDQASYDRAKQLAAQYGIEELDMLPAEYDPQIVEQIGLATMTYKEQIDMERQKQMDALTREKFEYGKEQDQMDEAYRRDKLNIDQQDAAQRRQLSGAELEMRRRQQDFQERKFESDEQRYQDKLADEQKRAEDPTYGLKPMPTSALKLQREEVEAIGLSGQINSDLGEVVNQIDQGKLKLGPVRNWMMAGQNAAGMSDEVSRNYASFKSTLEKLRNDSLRLNKGVQTEGDAQRAWNEILANMNDEQLVKERLQEVQAINQRGAQLRKMNVDMIRGNYGYPPIDDAEIFNQPSAVGSGGQGGQDEDPITAELRRRGAL